MPAVSAGSDTGSEPSAPELSAPPPPPAAPPVPVADTLAPDPTRYGDWERGGRCIDF